MIWFVEMISVKDSGFRWPTFWLQIVAKTYWVFFIFSVGDSDLKTCFVHLYSISVPLLAMIWWLNSFIISWFRVSVAYTDLASSSWVTLGRRLSAFVWAETFWPVAFPSLIPLSRLLAFFKLSRQTRRAAPWRKLFLFFSCFVLLFSA